MHGFAAGNPGTVGGLRRVRAKHFAQDDQVGVGAKAEEFGWRNLTLKGERLVNARGGIDVS